MFRFHPNRLQVKEKIGRGRFGTVFPYQKDPEDRKWVVKRIRAEDVDILLATLPEIILGFACDHPCVVPVKGYFIEKNSDYESFNIYMKLPRMKMSFQQDFKDRKKSNNSYSEEEIIRHFYSLACGIGYLHSKKIYHGDIKPDNLLLSEEGDLKIADIGIAKHVEDEDSYQTLTGITGTYHYSAPEILGESRKGTKKWALEKADVWSLGIVILELCLFDFRMLNVSLPQEKLRKNLDELIKSLDGKYNKSLIALIERSLSIDPEERISIRHIKSELENNFSQNLDKNLLSLEKSSRANDSAAVESQTEHLKEINERLQGEIKQLQQRISHLECDLHEQKQQHEERVKVLVGQTESKSREEFLQRESINHAHEAKIKHLEEELRNLKGSNNQAFLSEKKGHFYELQEKDFGKEYEQKLKTVILELNQELDQLFTASEEKKNLKIQHNGQKYLTNEKITDEHIASLSNSLTKLLQKNNFSSLAGLEIDCWGCTKLNDGAFLNLIKSISHPPLCLQSLSLSFAWCKQFTDDISVDLSLLISKKLPQLKHLTLDFRQCQQLSDKALLGLSLGLYSHSLHLESLNLDYGGCKKLTERALIELSSALLSQSFSLKHLSLNFGGCERLVDESFARLSTAFRDQLDHLTLNFTRCKELTDQALVYLASSIDSQPLNLQHLSLDFGECMNFTDKGLQRILTSIGNLSSNLKHLNLNFHDCKELTDRVLLDLAAALENKSLSSLEYLGGDFRSIPSFSDEGVSVLLPVIEKNLKSLQQLKLAFSTKGKVTSKMKERLKEKFRHIAKLEIV